SRDLLIARPLDRQADRGHFNRLAQLIKIEDLMRIEFPAIETLAWNEPKEAFRVEAIERLPQRRSAYTEVPRDFDLVQTFAGLERISYGHRFELFIDSLDDAVVRDLRWMPLS